VDSAKNIIGEDDTLIKNFDKNNRMSGIAAGIYDHFHKKNRQIWRMTTSKIIGNSKIREIITSSGNDACDEISKLANSQGTLNFESKDNFEKEQILIQMMLNAS
jgi:hypothetical protein